MARLKVASTVIASLFTSSSLFLCSRLKVDAFIATVTIPPSSSRGFATKTTSLHISHQQEQVVDGERSTDTSPPPPSYEIYQAQYSDLSQVANLITDGFYDVNPILRPIRYLLELDRLQNNFPYDDIDRHYYLVVVETTAPGISGSNNGSDDRKVIGFCDLDGRIVEKKKTSGMLNSLFTIMSVYRPQPYFSDLVIDSEYRRRGVGMALMNESEQLASSMGYDELYLGVKSTNEVALQMYEGIGYEFIVPQGDMLAFLEVDTNRGVRLLRRALL